MNTADRAEPISYPVVPRPCEDELLSSWIERVGLFYGTPYEPWIASLMIRVGLVASPIGYDADVDECVRQVMTDIAICDDELIPRTLASASLDVLIFGSRTAFCPLCWDDDVASGTAPFVRRSWSSWHRVICPVHRAFLWSRPRIGHRAAQGWPSWASLWRTRKSWAAALQLPRDRMLTEEVLSYSPGRKAGLSSAEIAELGAEIERFFPDGTSLNTSVYDDENGRRRAEKVLELTMSEGFISVTEDVRCEILGRRENAKLRAYRFDSMRYLSAPLRPQLLENRMALLMVAAEMLRIVEARSAINENVASALILSVLARCVLDNSDTQRWLSRWSESDRVKFARCWPTGRASRLKVREILAQRRSRLRT
jgi:hypothetical protein